MAIRFRSDAEAEAYLLGFVNFEAVSRYRPSSDTHDLRRFEGELRRLGWRPRGTRTIHVGGTNGKGTVSTILEAVLRAGGLRTGLYTSPHLRSWRERIRLDGRPIGSPRFRRDLARLAAGPWPRDGGFRTTFEHLTALALWTFQEAAVEVAVVEVGLGGRWDATNILPPGPALLTPVSLDHRQILGKTVGRIAADKAHILKRGGAAYLMPQGRVAAREIARRCRRMGLRPVLTSEAVQVRAVAWNARGTTFHLRGREDYGPVRTHLLGGHQEANLAAAVSLAERFLPRGRCVEAVRRGLSGIRVPGRLDLRSYEGTPLLLDGGHNPAAGRALAAALARHFPGARVAGVLGMARDKDRAGFIRSLAPRISSWHATAIRSPRGASPEHLAGRMPGGSRCHATVGDALRSADAGRPDLILVAGSFVLAGEVMEILERTGPPA